MALTDIRDALLTVLPGAVYHFEASESAQAPYLVWSEDTQGSAGMPTTPCSVKPYKALLTCIPGTNTTRCLTRYSGRLRYITSRSGCAPSNGNGTPV